MASIGDIWLSLVLKGEDLVFGATKQGTKAGEAAGKAMSSSLSATLKRGVVWGAGFEVGRQALHQIEDAVGDVINAIPDLIRSGEAFALTVDDISDKTNASAESASRFAGTLQYLGIPIDGIGTSLRTLSGEIVNNEAKLTDLGITTRDGNKHLLDTITILDNVRHYMAGAGDGAAKFALANDLLGKSAGDLIDYLNLTDAEALALAQTMDELGVTISADAVRQVEGLKRETNLLGLAWQGLANTLTTEAAPTIRAVIGGLTEFIKEHGGEIRQTFIDITNAVLGFVAGILDLDSVKPFQLQLDGLAGSADNVTLSFEQWAQQMGYDVASLEKTGKATGSTTDAIDRQIKSVDRQIERTKARDEADEQVFQRTMRRLSAEYGAQLDALDLQERQLAMADRDKTLTEQLRQAKIDLFEAQAQRGADVAAGKSGDTGTLAVAKAQQGVLDAQKAIADEAAQRDRDSQRQRLEGVKSYIEDVARIEADSENKKALASTLEKRRIKLVAELATAVAAKDAEAQKDIAARLEAVKTAETRTQTAIRNGDKQTELAGLKGQLEAQRQAIAAAGSGETADNKKKLAEWHADYQKYLDDNKAATAAYASKIGFLVMGDPDKGTGVGGALTNAFADGRASATELRDFLVGPLTDALNGIIGLASTLAGILDSQGFSMGAGVAIGSRFGPGGAVVGGAVGGIVAAKPGTMLLDPGGPLQGLLEAYDAVFGTNYSGTHAPPAPPHHRALGGPVEAGMPYLVGERRPEIFVPGESGRIIPSIAAMQGGLAGDTGTIHVDRISLELGGKQNRLIDWVDQELAYRRRR